MGNSACAICESALRHEIDKKDETWKADRTIRWARRHGVKINRTTLARHRADHKNSTSAGKAEKKPQSRSSKSKSTKQTVRTSNDLSGPTDLLFLDTIRDQVFKRLQNGDYDLKLESAFKAIEIKHKIADESKNEQLLLEILAEIRADELRQKKSAQLAEI
jgi:hypothetical protein